ncbi:tripartite tricarboxylate transporter substrate binding protein [Nocardiopsis sp. HNM0947]|uniref:Tripartite tricarboxylate transporter substrate binding protein n=1 Tax=Nocardiopsis coralli TaxID=2772213 RepID=A0ABR9P2X9_9ACTN|nr:tripartite tricarboxylate transporter substrate binding protein [Nocardiopsis coralli]MBE2998194.1 tripartite tricarboxylate transporter substrate binding protein [Nocardiopsis coralli]
MSPHPRPPRRTPRSFAAALLALGLAATACTVPQNEGAFPDRSIELIVPWPPGGSGDQTARLLVAEARETCGTDIIVRNQEGSIGAVGYQAMSEAEPDGHTLGIIGMELAILGHLGVSDIGPEDLRGVMQYSYQPDVFAVPADSPLENLDEVFDAAGDDGVKIATAGTGSVYHVSFSGMAMEAGVEEGMDNVPFDGSAPAITAALGDQTDMVAVGAAEIAPYIESGDLRALATTGQEEVFPGTPTLADQGLEWDSGAILGVVAPNGTPDERVGFLTECLGQAQGAEDFSAWMAAQNLDQEFRDGPDFDSYLDDQHELYGRTVQELGLAPEEEHL